MTHLKYTRPGANIVSRLTVYSNEGPTVLNIKCDFFSKQNTLLGQSHKIFDPMCLIKNIFLGPVLTDKKNYVLCRRIFACHV